MIHKRVYYHPYAMLCVSAYCKHRRRYCVVFIHLIQCLNFLCFYRVAYWPVTCMIILAEENEGESSEIAGSN